MTPSPHSTVPPSGRVSATSRADQRAGGERIVPPCAFVPVRLVRDDLAAIDTTTERHERLVAAAQRAPHGNKLRLQRMAREACLARLRAELAVTHG